MLDDDTLRGMYEERGVPTEWQELTPETLAPAYKLWYRALPSPKSDFMEGGEYAEWLIHDPLAALRDAGIIPSEDEEPRISTMVVNHEKTLCRFIMHTTVLVSTNPRTVGITIVKEESPGDPGCP